MQSSYNLEEWLQTLLVRRVTAVRAFAHFQSVVAYQGTLVGVVATANGVIMLLAVRPGIMRMTMKMMMIPCRYQIQMSRWLPYEE